MPEIREYFNSKSHELLHTLQEMVEIESPTTEPERVNQMGAYVQERLRELGASIEVDSQTERGDHVIGRFGSGPEKPILLIGHLDTVCRTGTLAERPFRVTDGKAYGPGTADMKSGLVIMLAAVEAIRDLELAPARPLTLLFNSDEEMQSRYSRELILKEAERSSHALVFEGSGDEADFCTSRKASGRFTLRARGVATHSGSALADGVNAIEELAHQVLAVQKLTDFSRETLVNVGTISGGDRPNIVADWAEAVLSVRAATQQEMERIEAELRALKPHLPGATLEIEGGFHREPFEPNQRNTELFKVLQQAAQAVGVSARATAGGGASDANLTAGAGIPTLDGLGAVGFGAHSENEHIIIDSLPLRAAIATELILRL